MALNGNRSTSLRLPAPLEVAFATQQVRTSGGVHALEGGVTRAEAAILFDLVSRLGPQRSVETGLAQGISAAAILAGLTAASVGEHHVIDPHQAQYSDAGVNFVRESGLGDKLHFHRDFPERVIPHLGRLQFAFIDSSHLFDLTMLEFVLIDKALDVGGILALHDMWMPAQQKFLRYVLSNRGYELVRDVDPAPRWPERLLSIATHTLARLPRADQLFTQEFLRPWKTLSIPNMVILRKISDDARHWTFYRPF